MYVYLTSSCENSLFTFAFFIFIHILVAQNIDLKYRIG